MRHFILSLFIATIAISCQTGNTQQNSNTEQLPLGTHKGEVSEVIQTDSYTYLLVKESQGDNWIAIPKATVEKGQTIYYDEGLEMNNFESKSLGRVFETVYFVKDIRDQAVKPINEAIQEKLNKKSAVSKTDISVEQPQGAQSIAEVYKNKAKYANQQINVRGQIVKVNNAILGTNWVHIQDGTNYNGEFDLTVTTNEQYQIGDAVTFMGTISLDKDFGAGYKYDIIMENAVKVVNQ